MYSDKDVERFVDEFTTNFEERPQVTEGTEGANPLKMVVLPSVEELKGYFERGDEEAVQAIRRGVRSLHNGATLCVPQAVTLFPKTNLSISASSMGDSHSIAGVSIVLSTSIKSEFPYKYSKYFPATDAETFFADVAGFFLETHSDMINLALQQSNVDYINEELDRIVSDAELPYTVHLALGSGRRGHAIAEITDGEVVFNADSSRLMSNPGVVFSTEGIDTLGIGVAQDEDDTEEESDYMRSLRKRIARVHERNVSIFRTLPTTVAFVKDKPDIIRMFVNLDRFKTCTLVNNSVSHTARALRVNTNDLRFGVSGVYGTAEVDGKEKNKRFFGIAERHDGEFDVVLHPFDMDTCEPVDVDILDRQYWNTQD